MNLKLKYLEWIDLKENLATLYAYSNEELKEEKINIDSLEQAANEREKYLSEATGLFDAGNDIALGGLTAMLEPQEALVDLVRFPEFKNGFTGRIIYAAIVAKPGTSTPQLQFLDNGTELEGKFFKYYRNMTGLQMSDQYSYENYWSQLAPLVDGVTTVYLAKDGIYNQISLPTLESPTGGFLVQQKSFVLLTNVADLAGIKQGSDKAAKPGSALLMGYPTYGSADISELPGTKVEVNTIDDILTSANIQTDKYLEQAASESNLKKASDYELVHVATHGFFLQDAAEAYNEKVFGVNVNHMEDNVFLRSGLMLSGAGAETGSGDFSAEENGIATAYEILNYSMDNVEMVVLSACETGLGEIKAGEGVYGLQRSLLMAGANSLIMSLWKVNDQATQDFMTTFYRNWVESEDRYKAFRSTQLAMSEKYEQPYFWGAFVIMGR